VQRWRKKLQRGIDRRLSGATNLELACSMCNIIIWWAEKHPEAETDAELARLALPHLTFGNGGNYGSSALSKLSIDRGGQGFKLTLWRVGAGHSYLYVTTRGLPAVPDSYEELPFNQVA
jgi:hypothetical protein